MAQANLLGWVKVQRQLREVAMYRFLQDLPEVMATEKDSIGPFRKGDLVSAESVPQTVWRVLRRHGVVESVYVDLTWPGTAHKSTRKLYKH